MAMKKIKPQYGKVVPPAIDVEENKEKLNNKEPEQKQSAKTLKPKSAQKPRKPSVADSAKGKEKSKFSPTSTPNPFLQSKEVLKQTNLTKIGYRMRSEYVELLDIQKKLKSGYTLEAVLDDALTFYFENSEDGKKALKKAQIFYS